MKKLFAILAVGTILVACNNSPEATAAAADTAKVVAPDTAAKVAADTTAKVDTSKVKVDTAAAKK